MGDDSAPLPFLDGLVGNRTIIMATILKLIGLCKYSAVGRCHSARRILVAALGGTDRDIVHYDNPLLLVRYTPSS